MLIISKAYSMLYSYLRTTQDFTSISIVLNAYFPYLLILFWKTSILSKTWRKKSSLVTNFYHNNYDHQESAEKIGGKPFLRFWPGSRNQLKRAFLVPTLAQFYWNPKLNFLKLKWVPHKPTPCVYIILFDKISCFSDWILMN